MNFFKSILSEDPDPPAPGKADGFGPDFPRNASDGSDADEESDAKPNPPAGGGGWSFGGLMQTLASRSESVIETYRRDLEEFGSGLRKETETLRDVASRAVKELPASIEVGASKAHGSLESVIKSTAGIISQGLETAAGSISDAEPDTPESIRKLSSAKYSRFDAQLNAIQSDRSTFCEEPEDLNDFRNWKLGFVLEEKAEEMSNLIGEDGALEAVHSKVVPSVVDDEIFWCRYFYRVHKLRQQESVRVNLVKRAISADEEEELSWDVDDEDDEDETSLKGSLPPESSTRDDSQTQSSTASANDDPTIDDHEEGAEMEENMVKVVKRDEEKASSVDAAKVDHVESGKDSDVSKASSVDAAKVDHVESGKDSDVSKASSVDAAKVDHVESGKDSDVSKASSVDAAKVDLVESGKDSKANDVLSQKSTNEDRDLDWDELEDIGSGDEKRASPIAHGGSPSSADLKNRLSTATTAEEEDEELTWDIEDED